MRTGTTATEPYRRRSRWSTPMEMFGSLLTGIVLAVGHDQFYRRMHGKFINGGDGLDWNASPIPQEWVIRIGTAFAFLVKTFLVTAACIAYSQRMWYHLKTNEFKIRHIDSLTSVLVNIFSFRHLGLWARVPLLALIGIAVWALIIIAVVTPGTLTVIPSLTSNVTLLRVPQLSYNVTNYAQTLPTNGNYAFQESSAAVRRVAFASATSGSILPIPHPFVNMTYTLSFPSPAIQCSPANDTLVSALKSSLSRFSGSGGAVLFLSWAGDIGVELLAANNTWSPEKQPSGTLDFRSEDATKLFFMSAQGRSERGENIFRNVTQCVLHNATYTAEFSFFEKGGGQIVEVHDLQFGEKLPVLGQPASSVRGISAAEGQHMAYQAVMDAFGKIFVGAEHGRGGPSSSTYGTSFKLTGVRWQEFEETQRDLEQLFRNVTVSMFASGDLILEEAQSSPVPATVISFPPSYQYAPRDLLITYGVGVGVTFIASLIGMHAIMLNGRASYSTKFSTFVRITRRKGLDGVVDDADCGWSPLPKNVGDAKFALHRNGGDHVVLQDNLKGSERRLVTEAYPIRE